MICIAESGSTKTHWVLINSLRETVFRGTTMGMNPFFIAEDEVRDAVQKEIPPAMAADVSAVFFYGAGCSSGDRNELIRRGLQPVFTGARIAVEHDLLAAARAACGRDAGIVCILGTGSNSCAYDGNDIVDNVPSLGFILGDEGSGSALGKALIQAWNYREMPDDLSEAFVNAFGVTKEGVLNAVYKQAQPNRFLASFAPFCSAHRHHAFIQKIISSCMEAFVVHHVLKYAIAKSTPIHFIGSVASVFRPELEEVLQSHGLSAGRFVSSPIDDLVQYHASHAH